MKEFTSGNFFLFFLNIFDLNDRSFSQSQRTPIRYRSLCSWESSYRSHLSTQHRAAIPSSTNSRVIQLSTVSNSELHEVTSRDILILHTSKSLEFLRGALAMMSVAQARPQKARKFPRHDSEQKYDLHKHPAMHFYMPAKGEVVQTVSCHSADYDKNKPICAPTPISVLYPPHITRNIWRKTATVLERGSTVPHSTVRGTVCTMQQVAASAKKYMGISPTWTKNRY